MEAAVAYAASNGKAVPLSAVMEPIFADINELVNRYGEPGTPFVIAAMELVSTSLRAMNPGASNVAEGVKALVGVISTRKQQKGE